MRKGAHLGVLLDDQDKAHPIPKEDRSVWTFDEDDMLLYALLADPVYHPELLWDDPNNRDYSGQYVVRDYQYPLFRLGDVGNYAGAACGRSTGKTESVKARSCTHPIRRMRQNLLITAPELIHLLPLTDAIEAKIRDTRLLREFLDMRNQKTGFTHRPFGVDFIDGTKIVGRIPRLTGTGVKGQHQPDLIIDEAQDYPEKGWTEVHETVMKDQPDFTYHFYGVHSGARDTGFYTRVSEGGFQIVNVTALQRPDWDAAQKKAARAAYGGTAAPDYRRNILGEPGGAASPYFVTARLMACVDQDRDSHYNTVEVPVQSFRHPDNDKCQLIRVEEFDDLAMPIAEILDLPRGYKEVYGGMDVGLTNSPTVIMLFAEVMVGKKKRLKLIRRIHLERMRTRTIRETLYAIAYAYGTNLKGFGIDATGLGFPLWQEMEDDESAPQHLLDVTSGYFFNANVPVGVDKEYVTTDASGTMRDQFGAAVKEEFDPLTNTMRYVTYMPMIEASTRYLREFVDATYLMLPFDPQITSDMQGETQQRVKRIAGLKNKPNAFHILDAMRAMAMRRKHEEIEETLAYDGQVPVLDVAL